MIDRAELVFVPMPCFSRGVILRFISSVSSQPWYVGSHLCKTEFCSGVDCVASDLGAAG